MKHRVLIEFESSKLPADFTDIVLNRIYMLDCVDKVECTATLVGDVLKDAERYQWLKDNCAYHYSMQPDSPAEHGIEYQWQQGTYEERNQGIDESIDESIDAAKDTQCT